MRNILGLFGACAVGRTGRTVRTTLLMSGLATALITAAHAQLVTWLGTLGGDRSEAYGVSDNGVVVGSARNASRHWRAFRWANGTMQDLGTLLGGDFSKAYGVSADGSVVVGWADNASGYWRAFRWVNGTMQDLGTLGGDWSYAFGVSADGRVVVGWADSHAFRWESGTMQDLGTLGGDYSAANGVSADGSVVVGGANAIALHQGRAVRWTSNGIEDLNTIAIGLSPGSYLRTASAISPNGRYIVGVGYNASTRHYEGWVMDLQVGS